MSKTKINFIYNSIYQIFSIAVPIILAPFLARRLGSDAIGIYSYTYSIVYYFMLFIMLGVNNYGSRVVAKCKNNKEKLDKRICEIYSIQLSLGILIILLYLLFITQISTEYHTIFLIQGFFVISAALDINWIFFGLEKFKTTTLRSLAIKFLNLILTIALVRRPEDLWVYTLIMSITALTNQLILWPFLIKTVHLVRPRLIDIKTHLKPLLLLFIPAVAVSLYKIMDKIMLGLLSSMDSVGFYEYAEKINSIPLMIITALGTVMLPKISSIFNDKQRVSAYISKSAKFVLLLTVPLPYIFILALPFVVPFYLGNEFMSVIILSIILSISLPFVSVANIIRTQYLIPAEMDRTYTLSVIIGALLNLISNLILIPFIGSIGACIGTLIAEISVMIFQAIKIRKEIKLKKILRSWFLIFTKSTFAFLICLPISLLEINQFLTTLIQSAIFAALYLLMNFKEIATIANRKSIIRR